MSEWWFDLKLPTFCFWFFKIIKNKNKKKEEEEGSIKQIREIKKMNFQLCGYFF